MNVSLVKICNPEDARKPIRLQFSDASCIHAWSMRLASVMMDTFAYCMPIPVGVTENVLCNALDKGDCEMYSIE